MTDNVMTCLLTGNFWGCFSLSEQTDLYERMQQPEKYLATLAQQSDIRLPGYVSFVSWRTNSKYEL